MQSPKSKEIYLPENHEIARSLQDPCAIFMLVVMEVTSILYSFPSPKTLKRKVDRTVSSLLYLTETRIQGRNISNRTS